MVGYITELNDDSFKQFIELDDLTLIYAWASWCATCDIINTYIHEVSSEYLGRVRVGRIESNNLQAMSDLKIRNVPVILLLKNGEVKELLSGTFTKSEIIALIEKNS